MGCKKKQTILDGTKCATLLWTVSGRMDVGLRKVSECWGASLAGCSLRKGARVQSHRPQSRDLLTSQHPSKGSRTGSGETDSFSHEARPAGMFTVIRAVHP